MSVEIIGMAISPWLLMTFMLRRWTLLAIALCGASSVTEDRGDLCKSAWGPHVDRRAELLIYWAARGSILAACSHSVEVRVVSFGDAVAARFT